MSPTPGPFYLTIEDAKDLMPFMTKLQGNRLRAYIENNLPTINPQMRGYYLYRFCFNIINRIPINSHRPRKVLLRIINRPVL